MENYGTWQFDLTWQADDDNFDPSAHKLLLLAQTRLADVHKSKFQDTPYVIRLYFGIFRHQAQGGLTQIDN